VRQQKVVVEASESFEISSADLALSEDEEYKSPPKKVLKTMAEVGANRNSMPVKGG
jgi:hypothetical protein